jgi:uncharacterized protein YndB with AHSA1/START domain
VTALAPALDQLTLDITEETLVRAPIAAAFDALLEEIGPSARGHEDTPMPMKLEPWPGGRWYRDLGDGNGHFWGQVQAIKRPSLLELTGPMMMSFAVASNVQYRLKEVDGGTLITLRHTALGLFPDGYRAPLTQGWKGIFDRVRQRAERSSR